MFYVDDESKLPSGASSSFPQSVSSSLSPQLGIVRCLNSHHQYQQSSTSNASGTYSPYSSFRGLTQTKQQQQQQQQQQFLNPNVRCPQFNIFTRAQGGNHIDLLVVPPGRQNSFESIVIVS